MRRKTLTYSEFMEQFPHPQGYLPVDVATTENQDGSFSKSLDIWLIVPWRLDDGKVLFLTVTFDTQEQLNALRNWVLLGAARLKLEVGRRVEDLLGLDTLSL